MMFMNEYEIEEMNWRFDPQQHPNLLLGARNLQNLVDWTNRESDGWAYWPKPCRAAKSLMTLLESVDRFDPQDVSAADLKKALTPIKAFLTRQGVPHGQVIASS